MNYKAIHLTCDLTGDLSEARACEKMPDDARHQRASADSPSVGDSDLQDANVLATPDGP